MGGIVGDLLQHSFLVDAGGLRTAADKRENRPNKYVVRHGYRLGVPAAGRYREIINTDNAVYGGSGVGNGVTQSEAMDWQGQAQSLVISVPPLGTVMWVLE